MHRSAPWAVALAVSAACVHRPAPSPAAGTPSPAPAAKPQPAPSPAVAAGRAKGPSPHLKDAEGRSRCEACHEPGEGVAKVDPIRLCSDCHDVGYMRHPFRVEAPGSAEGLPLLAGRLVACHTCHDPHETKARRGGLRMPFKELCVKCHERHGQRHAPDGTPAGLPPNHP